MGTQDGQKPSPDSDMYRLYFKGLIRKETRGFVAGFGVAICGQEDNLLFQMKGSLHDSAITVLEAELMALKQGLTEAVGLGITHISIYCHYQIFELVMGRSVPEKENIALIMYDVQRIRQQLKSSTPLLVTGNQTNKFAYDLALETLVSEISISMCFLLIRRRLVSVSVSKLSRCFLLLDEVINSASTFTIGPVEGTRLQLRIELDYQKLCTSFDT